MGLQVGPVVVSCAKLLPTLLALVGLFASVDLLMPLKVGNLITIRDVNRNKFQYLSEGLVAAWMGAFVWLLPRVDAKMLLEGGILSERLSTALEVTRRVEWL